MCLQLDFVAANITPHVVSQGKLEIIHIKVFTNRILGRLSEAWPCYRVARDIAPSRYIYPIAKNKQWLEDDMKWILRDEKACMKTSKKERKAG